jgi:hypothetical protein
MPSRGSRTASVLGFYFRGWAIESPQRCLGTPTCDRETFVGVGEYERMPIVDRFSQWCLRLLIIALQRWAEVRIVRALDQ